MSLQRDLVRVHLRRARVTTLLQMDTAVVCVRRHVLHSRLKVVIGAAQVVRFGIQLGLSSANTDVSVVELVPVIAPLALSLSMLTRQLGLLHLAEPAFSDAHLAFFGGVGVVVVALSQRHRSH